MKLLSRTALFSIVLSTLLMAGCSIGALGGSSDDLTTGGTTAGSTTNQTFVQQVQDLVAAPSETAEPIDINDPTFMIEVDDQAEPIDIN